MKFPTPMRVKMVRGNQWDNRKCYVECVKDANRLRKCTKTDKSEIATTSSGHREVSIISNAYHLNSRMPEKEINAEPMEELVEINLDEAEEDKKVKVEADLSDENRKKIIRCLKQNLDVFAWTHDDMVSINP